MREVEVFDEGADYDVASAAPGVEGVLAHKDSAGLAGAVFEGGLEDITDGGFVGDVEVDELVEDGVVGFDGLVGGFRIQRSHSIQFPLNVIEMTLVFSFWLAERSRGAVFFVC